MSPSQRTALAQYAGRLHRLHDAKREVIIYDYVDMSVPVLARMAAGAVWAIDLAVFRVTLRTVVHSFTHLQVFLAPSLLSGDLTIKASDILLRK
jgi:hypothetical protein